MEADRLKKVDQYLDGLMSEEEHLDFEKMLANDKSLQKQLKFVQFERQIIATNANSQRLAKIKNWDKQYLKKESIKKTVLIGIVAIIIISGFLLYHGGHFLHGKPELNQSDKKLVALYTSPESSLGQIQRPGNVNQDIPLNITQKYLLAHQQFQNKQYKQAEEIFRELIADVNYGLDAEWYTVLSYYTYSVNTTTEIPILLSIIEDDEHPYFDKAKQLKILLVGRSK